MADHREYIAQQYRQAWIEYRTAHTEDEQWVARKSMARLERMAAEMYGFEFSDSLHQLREEIA